MCLSTSSSLRHWYCFMMCVSFWCLMQASFLPVRLSVLCRLPPYHPTSLILSVFILQPPPLLPPCILSSYLPYCAFTVSLLAYLSVSFLLVLSSVIPHRTLSCFSYEQNLMEKIRNGNANKPNLTVSFSWRSHDYNFLLQYDYLPY